MSKKNKSEPNFLIFPYFFMSLVLLFPIVIILKSMLGLWGDIEVGGFGQDILFGNSMKVWVLTVLSLASLFYFSIRRKSYSILLSLAVILISVIFIYYYRNYYLYIG